MSSSLLRLLLPVSALVLAVNPAAADIAPPPGYVETCRLDKVQKKGETCTRCRAWHRERDACATRYADKEGYERRCRTRGASVWTEIWCGPQQSAPSTGGPADPQQPADAQPAPFNGETKPAGASVAQEAGAQATPRPSSAEAPPAKERSAGDGASPPNTKPAVAAPIAEGKGSCEAAGGAAPLTAALAIVLMCVRLRRRWA